jgi:hypothetical protein
MAAWFLMAVLVTGSLLAGAAKIVGPPWLTATLALVAAIIPLVAMLCVFLMLTRYRHNLQPHAQYSEWLRDEARYSNGTPAGSATDEAPALPEDSRLDDFAFFRSVATTFIKVSRIPGYDMLLRSFRKLGFRAEVYDPNGCASEMHETDEQAAIWLGSAVDPAVAVLAIKTAVRSWPHLRYIAIAGDFAKSPAYVHDEIFFGGSTATAQRRGLTPWLVEEIVNLNDEISSIELHDLVRSRYEAAAVSA